MSKLKMSGMQSDSRNTSLRRLFGMVLSVADDWMAERRKLHPDLILQPCHQRDSDKRSAAQQALDRIAKFSTGCFRVALPSQFLEHSFLPKMVNERAFFVLEVPAHDREILPYRSMVEKLPDQRLPIRPALGKQQDPGCVSINAMYDEGPLPLLF